MNFHHYLILLLFVFVFHLGLSRPTLKEKEETLQSCLKLKAQAPYLNLNCDNLIETTSHGTVKETIITEDNIHLLSLNELQGNIKKINKTEEAKLFKMINNLKSKNEETAFLAY